MATVGPQAGQAPTCRWFALCDHPAAGTVAHPILGPVPTCTRCTNRLGLALVPYPSSTQDGAVP